MTRVLNDCIGMQQLQVESLLSQQTFDVDELRQTCDDLRDEESSKTVSVSMTEQSSFSIDNILSSTTQRRHQGVENHEKLHHYHRNQTVRDYHYHQSLAALPLTHAFYGQ